MRDPFGTAVNPLHLRTFLAVRKHLNYTRAGEEVFLSQPAVSRQIRRLEKHLGVRLFEQIGKSLHLTHEGKVLAGEAEKLLGAMERTAEAVRAHRSAEHGFLRIGASTTPGFYLLPEQLGRFHREYPEVELDYVVENSLRIEQMIIRNELDLGFVGAHLSNRELSMEPVVEDEIACFASPSHRLGRRSRRGRITAVDLERETWVVRERGSATRRLFEDWLAAQGGRIGRAIELHCPEAVKVVVSAGVGFSFMSVHGLRRELRARQLKRLPVAGLDLKRPIYLVRHVEKHESPVILAFRDMIRAAFLEL